LDNIDNDCYDAYRGQINCQLIAYNKEDTCIGYLGYSIFEEKIYIDNLTIKNNCRRKGIASKMMKKLEEQDLPINIGFTTPDGTFFFEKYKERKRKT
jgi:predicted GNAT family acetyltransferase